MISHAAHSFWQRFDRLPLSLQKRTRAAFEKFQINPYHPSLKLKKLRGFSNYWSARVSLDFRAVAVREGDVFLWFWIGSHADFDRDFG